MKTCLVDLLLLYNNIFYLIMAATLYSYSHFQPRNSARYGDEHRATHHEKDDGRQLVVNSHQQ